VRPLVSECECGFGSGFDFQSTRVWWGWGGVVEGWRQVIKTIGTHWSASRMDLTASVAMWYVPVTCLHGMMSCTAWPEPVVCFV
jgi:hypothetical protein